MDFFDVTIRPASPDDAVAIERLAQLDSSERPPGDLLVAEVAGEPIAAISLSSGEAVADPFRHTAEPVRLLSLRREQLEHARAHSRLTDRALPAGRGRRVRAL
jgi:hypothetical protein